MTPVSVIRRAIRQLEEGQPADALETLRGSSGPASQSLFLTARGLIAEREGNRVEADSCFREVLDLGVPLAVPLRECGKHFKRTGDYRRAFHCYSILNAFDRRAMKELLDGLPGPELARYAPWAVRQALGRPRPGHWFLPPIKEALESELGVDAAVTAFAEMTRQGSGWEAARMRIGSLRDHACAHGLVYDVLFPGRDVHLPATPIFGGPEQPGVEARTRTVFFSVMADVVVSSKSNFLLVEDRALLDYQEDELERIPLELDVDPIVFAPADDEVTVLIGDGAARPPLEQAFPLVGVNSYNFGHWLIEFLPRVLACLERPGFESVPILVDEQMPPQSLEALRLTVGSGHPIVTLKRGEAVRVAKLWICAMVPYVPLCPRPGADSRRDFLALDGDAFVTLLAKLLPTLEALGEPRGPKRIYMSRKPSQHRGLANHDEVEAWFAERGFQIFDFGELSFREQVTLVRGADLIVGPDGSSNLLSFFARPGTRIGIMTNPHAEQNEWYTLVCHRLNHRLSILTGEFAKAHPDYDHRSDYRIDLAALSPFLDELDSA